jgi:hypothetical protein
MRKPFAGEYSVTYSMHGHYTFTCIVKESTSKQTLGSDTTGVKVKTGELY